MLGVGTGQPCSQVISPCVSRQHKHDFLDLKNPHLPSWNTSEEGTVPDHIATVGASNSGCCRDDWLSERQDVGFRNRTASCVDLDDMIGHILMGLEQLAVLDDTFVIFTADNGYVRPYV
jgi:arylsulfatase A-like enzyme